MIEITSLVQVRVVMCSFHNDPATAMISLKFPSDFTCNKESICKQIRQREYNFKQKV